MTECERLDRHDHDDARLPDYFHAWLRGERRQAPPMRSSGLNARRADRDNGEEAVA